jgi:periplasmic protein TonB
MALVSTDFADAGRIVPKDESVVALYARKGGPARSLIENRTQGLAVLAAVFTLHTGILAILDRFDLKVVDLAAVREIPVDLVAAIPAPEPKAAEPQSKGSEAGKPQEKPEAPQTAETPAPKPVQAPEASAPQQPKSDPPQATPEASKPEPPKLGAQKPEPPKPEPPKPEQQKPEQQKADARKPPKSDNRKSVTKPPEPAKATAANRARQDPAPPQEQAARPEQPKPTADTAHQQPNITAEATAQQPANPPAAPLRFSIASDSFRAMALPHPTDDGDDPMSYTMLVFSRLELAKKYPEAAFARGARGSAGIGFTLDDAGNVLDAELLVSSGDADLDEESLALVRRAAPFPPPPAGAKRRFDAVVTFDQKRTLQAN